MKNLRYFRPVCFFVGLVIAFSCFFAKPSNAEQFDFSSKISSGAVSPLLTKNFFGLTSQIRSYGSSSSDYLTLVPPEKRYALLIGVNKYKDSRILPLVSCVKDMTDLKDVLIKYAKFKPENITLMTDESTGNLFPTAENIRKKVAALKYSIPKDALLIVAFSCHGTVIDMQDGTSAKSYLCVYDTGFTDIDSYIDRSWLFKTIDECPAEKKLLFCDACRSLTTKAQLTAISGMTPDGKAIQFKKMETPSKASWNYNFILMSSCSEGQTSLDAGVNGLFISFLLEGIRTGGAALQDGDLTASSWFDYAYKKTVLVSRQRFKEDPNAGLIDQKEQTPRINIPAEASSFIIAKLERSTLNIVLPDDPNQIRVQTYTINDLDDIKINSDVKPIPSKPIKSDKIQLPPIPEEISKQIAVIRGIVQAAEELKNGTHPVLDKPKAVLSQAKLQYDSIKAKRDDMWQKLNSYTRASLSSKIAQDPNISPTTLDYLRPNDVGYSEFIKMIVLGKKTEQAKKVLEKVQEDIETARTKKAKSMIEEINDCIKKIEEPIKAFREKLLLSFLEKCDGYDDVSVNDISDEGVLYLADAIPALLNYDLGWDEKSLWTEAKLIWKERRPCILQKKQREEQERIAREIAEKERLAREKAEEDRNARERAKREWQEIIDKARAEREEQERIARERAEREEQERIARERAEREEQERIALERAEREEQERLERERLEQERIARERAEREEQERIAQERASAGKRVVKVINGVEFAFRFCPFGTFMMGSPTTEKGRKNDEMQHMVMITNSFWMMETEVTQKQWKAVMGNNPSRFKDDNLPVEGVSWNDCQKFCKKCQQLGLLVQLPTEAQWEYACRAGSYSAFAGNLSEMAWYEDNSDKKTHPVGTKKPNAWGLYDMHGNVYEWCQDLYGNYPSGTITDPTGPWEGTGLVYRGGSWTYSASYCRSASRYRNNPNLQNSFLGFRCLIELSSSNRSWLNQNKKLNNNLQTMVSVNADSGNNKKVQNKKLNSNSQRNLSGKIDSENNNSKLYAGKRDVKVINGVEFAFRYCPAGTFKMGSTDGYNSDERLHQVKLTKGFWMMETEVTQKQWKAIMGNNPSYFKGNNLPVECISWNDCQDFCIKCSEFGLHLQLPTEAQWEYACRARTTGELAGNLNEMAWYSANSNSETHPVGTKKPNNWGLYDMHGNVQEWCADRKADYPSWSVTDPVGPSVGKDRVSRGGSWYRIPVYCRSSFRFYDDANHRINTLGFRCVINNDGFIQYNNHPLEEDYYNQPIEDEDDMDDLFLDDEDDSDDPFLENEVDLDDFFGIKGNR